MSSKCVYANGDSFLAGCELGDVLLPNHPGCLDFDSHIVNYDKHYLFKQWYEDSYDSNTIMGKKRIELTKEIVQSELENCFINKLNKDHSQINVTYINKSRSAQSMPSIARNLIFDCIKLKSEYKEITAIVGLTGVERFDIPHSEETWISLSNAYDLPNLSESLGCVSEYYAMNYTKIHAIQQYFMSLISIQNFCALHNIKLYWIETFYKYGSQYYEIFGKDSSSSESEMYNILKEYLNINISISMYEIAKNLYYDTVLPSGHYSQKVHDVVYEKFLKILMDSNA